MANYRDGILRHEKEINRLNDAIHETVQLREKSQSHREKWIRAAAEFRNHHSSIDDWVEDIEQNEIFDWENAREFTFQYFEIDPIYFGSGYVKEKMVQKVKKCELTSKEAEIIRTLIIRRIQAGAMREFRRFCQLIPRVQNDAFYDEVEALANVNDKAVLNRARFALQYFDDT